MKRKRNETPATQTAETIFGHLRCPISLAVFVDPVIAEDQQTYERSSFKQLCKGESHFESPITRQQVSAAVCISNLALRDVVTRAISVYGNLLSAEELEDYHGREKVRTIDTIKAKIDSAEEMGDFEGVLKEWLQGPLFSATLDAMIWRQTRRTTVSTTHTH